MIRACDFDATGCQLVHCIFH